MLFFLNYFISNFKKYTQEIFIFYNNFIKIYLRNYNDLIFVISFLKLHTFFKFQVLTDIICVDNLKKLKRFTLNYNLLSIKFNFRLILSINLNENIAIESLSNIYSGSN